MAAFPNDMKDFTAVIAKACDDANIMMNSYVEATTKSTAAALQGIEIMSRSMTSLMQDSVARTLNASKTMMTAKSPQEAADTHAEFMKDCFDTLVANGSKISEISLHAAKGAIDPLTQHANEAMGAAMKKARAAS